jgi:hypothetical protein
MLEWSGRKGQGTFGYVCIGLAGEIVNGKEVLCCASHAKMTVLLIKGSIQGT